MKIIAVDNFDREAVSDTLVATGLNKYYGELFIRCLLGRMHEHDETYYRLVEDDHELYVFEP